MDTEDNPHKNVLREQRAYVKVVLVLKTIIIHAALLIDSPQPKVQKIIIYEKNRLKVDVIPTFYH